MARVKYFNPDTEKWQYADACFSAGVSPDGNVSAPSDWNAAEGEPGHVLNRTHWRDVTETVLFEKTVTITQYQFIDASGASIPLVVGDTYTVVWDGVQYEQVAKAVDFNGFDTVAVGNVAFTLAEGAEDTGEPFLIANIEGMGYGVVCLTDGEHTLVIIGKKYTYHTIPPEYLAGSKPFYIDLKTDENHNIIYETDVTENDVKNALARGYQVVVRRTQPQWNWLDLFLMDRRVNNGRLYFYRITGREVNNDIKDPMDYEFLQFTPNDAGGYDITHQSVALVQKSDFPSALKNPYALTINGTVYDGSEAVTIETGNGGNAEDGFSPIAKVEQTATGAVISITDKFGTTEATITNGKDGADGQPGEDGKDGQQGQRGTGLLPVTTAPESYTTAVDGITPKYRIAISTIKTQAGVTEVLLGDTVRSSYYHYPIAYLDSSYAYFTTRVSIRGATGSAGAAGTSITVTDVVESTEDGGSNVVTFSDGTTLTVKNGSNGSSGESTESIPDYVRTEAERVAAVVQSRQNADTLTFLAASDFHYSAKISNAAQQKESLTHMGQAMELIRKMVHVDFTVALGDMIWDSGETVDEAMAAMRFVNECLYGGHVGTDHFRTRGNHDCLYSSEGLTDVQIFANIGAWNSGAQHDPDNRLGGYCYRDFDHVKVRVICLNSAETNTGGCLFSAKQVAWLTNVLNLSEKGEDWRSVIVSHHPLDWGKDGGGDPIAAINGATGVIATFHGHLHNFKVDTIAGTSIKRIAIPNACVGRENEYTTAYSINWGEATKYTKTAGTAEDTSFCVVTIDLVEKKIYADHYGAGYSREVEYANTGDSGYDNAVDTAEADNSTDLYNGTGYKNGVYCSSNGGDSDDTACVATGNMSYNWATDNPIYIKGASVTSTGHVRIYGYSTKGAAPLNSACCSGPTISTYFTMEELETGNYYKLTPKNNVATVKYLRLSLIDTGNKPIVSFGKPIE